MGAPTDRSEETKRKLLLAARELVVEQGWSAVSNRAIAERAGVNLALINYHFGGQKPLLVAMLDLAVSEIAAHYTPPGTGSDITAFVSGAIEVVPRLAEDPNVRVLAVAMLEATFDPAIAGAVKRNLGALRDQIAEVVRASGVPTRRRAGLVTLLAALMDGVLLHFLLDPQTNVESAAATVRQIRWTAPA